MPAIRCPAGSTPSAARSATAPGISPSPQALSIGAGRGSRTTTSSPARAAYNAVARPTGPPPATTRSTGSGIDDRRSVPGQRRQGGVLNPDADRQQPGVEDGEDGRGDPRGVHERQRDALEHDRDVVG